MDCKKWLALIKKPTKTGILFAIGLAGILLIGLAGLFGGRQAEKPEIAASRVSTEDYAAALEEKLQNTVARIRGAGRCSVMVTMEQGAEYVYATGEKTSVDTSQTSEDSRFSTGSRASGEETYILISTKEGDQPLLLTELAPRVKGVVVVCSGGGDAVVADTIKRTVATAVDVSMNRICVVEGNLTQ